MEGRADDALVEAEVALRLDPESPDANGAAANVYYGLGRFADAAPLLEKSTALSETDFATSTMALSCYTALGDGEGALRAARLALKRAETALERDVANGSALGCGAFALAALGEGDRARDWVRRALLMDPDNQVMRYNLACALSVHLHDLDGAIELLGPYFAVMSDRSYVALARTDPDLGPLRDDPRLAAMLADADARLAAKQDA
jgi:adenylate cyclase